MIEVVGIGDDGWDGLSPSARAIVSTASVLVGGPRHLDRIPAGSARRVAWPSPLMPALRTFVEGLGPDIVVLASGDPLRSGIGTTLLREVGPDRVRIHPTVSSDTLARARMGWAAEDVDVVTLVGRDPDRLRPFVTPTARLVVLCSTGAVPAEVARIVADSGAPDAELTAWWHLGGADEGHRTGTAGSWSPEPTPDLVVVCVEVPREMPDTPGLGAAPGRPDETFEHDGLLTKRDVRASALARLRPTPGGVLWDLGAGSGAVGIEWALAAPRARVVAVESNADRAERIERNAVTAGVADRLQVLRARTAEIVERADLPTPDAVFFGGGLAAETIDAAVARLVPAGRIVAHAVTVESEQLLLDAARRHGGDLVRLSLEHLEPLGRFSGWRPARAVVSWSAVAPHPEKDAE